MTMTAQQHRETANAMEAWPHREIERMTILGVWVSDLSAPESWEAQCAYRIKPEPKTRPWSGPDDVPAFCWLKTPMGNASLVVHVATEGIGMIGTTGTFKLTWDGLVREKSEWSTDRKTWFKCEVQE